MIEGIDKHMSKLTLGTHVYRLDSKDNWFGVMDEFLEQRGTAIDTAYGYGGGESEEVIGQWMESRGVRDRVILTTKGGSGTGHGLDTDDFASTIESQLTTSLERLRTDYVDLHMLHRDSPTVPVSVIIDCLNAELNRGRSRAFAASNWEYSRVTEANQYARDNNLRGFSVVSNNVTLAVPTEPFWPGLIWVDKAGEEWHRQTGIPLVVWSSGARGFFTGNWTPEMRIEDIKDEREALLATRMVKVFCTDDNFERLRRAAELGEKKGGYSAQEMSYAWLLHKPFTLIPIVGPRIKAEVGSCFRAVSIELTQQETEWLNLEDNDG